VKGAYGMNTVPQRIIVERPSCASAEPATLQQQLGRALQRASTPEAACKLFIAAEAYHTAAVRRQEAEETANACLDQETAARNHYEEVLADVLGVHP